MRLFDVFERKMTSFYWRLKRAEKRAGKRLIERLIRRYGWHNTVLDTKVPNVPFLKVERLVVRNGYGQTHTIA